MSTAEQQLTALFQQLGAADQATLLSFAAFLASRGPGGSVPAVPVVQEPVVIPDPEQIARPAEESIVAALKRLAKTYPMLDKSAMLTATSDLVATAIMQGGDPSGVIDQLQEIFASHYEQLVRDNEEPGA